MNPEEQTQTPEPGQTDGQTTTQDTQTLLQDIKTEIQKITEQEGQQFQTELEKLDKLIELLQAQKQSLESTTSDTTQGYEAVLVKLDEIQQKMDDSNQIIVEAGWMITLSVVLAVGLKLFWDNVLKW